MTDAPEPSSEDVRAQALTIYADAILSGALRWQHGRWEFVATGRSSDVQDGAEAAAAFLRRLGMLGKGKA